MENQHSITPPSEAPKHYQVPGERTSNPDETAKATKLEIRGYENEFADAETEDFYASLYRTLKPLALTLRNIALSRKKFD